MRPHPALWIVSWVLIALGVLFYVLSVVGAFWPEATPWNDVGLYTVTVTLIGFGVGGLLLRSAKLHPQPGE
jgi:hypothetical protein